MPFSIPSIPFVFALSLMCLNANTQNEYQRHWQVADDNGIFWGLKNNQNLPHADNIEMAGKRVAGIISYEIDTAGYLTLDRQIFFPQLHPFIKSTDRDWYVYRAYLKDKYGDDILPKIFIDDKRFVPGKLKSVAINGLLNFIHHPSIKGLSLERKLFPSTDERLFIEHWILTNTTDSVLTVFSGNTKLEYVDYGAEGKFTQSIVSDAPEKIDLNAGDSFSFSLKIMAKKESENFPETPANTELSKRNGFLEKISSSLILETPDPILNTLFEFSKIRASESIFESKLGLIHSPGGGRYYVGIWANDQAEYVSPLFPYIGYDIGNESAINTYRAFAKEINPEFNKIRYAFEIEGNVPPFLLDRGDAAMIAYGATQFVLAYGNKETAEEFWPLIKWCLEYCRRQLNEEGVVKSESDEMEGRIETGTANLSTNSLYYGALMNAVYLGGALNRPSSVVLNYKAQAFELNKNIEKYFGANVEGLETYKYYKEHKHLRHWICMPLVVGIYERSEATTKALFEKLWADDGVYVEKNSDNPDISKIFWDRGTLYALRGTFNAGATDVSLNKLQEYSGERLLGKRVPYAVEAFPEGSMAHLSAESGLYCRIFTEGLFGILPTGFNRFNCQPRLPADWDEMALKHIKAFGDDFDIYVSRKDNGLVVKIFSHKKNKIIQETAIQEGSNLEVIMGE